MRICIVVFCLLIGLSPPAFSQSAEERIILPETGRVVNIKDVYATRAGWGVVSHMLVVADYGGPGTVVESHSRADELFERLFMYVGQDAGAQSVLIQMLPTGGDPENEAFISSYVHTDNGLWQLEGRQPTWDETAYANSTAIDLKGLPAVRQERTFLGFVELEANKPPQRFLRADLLFNDPNFDLREKSSEVLVQAWTERYRRETASRGGFGTELTLHKVPRRGRFHVRSFAMSRMPLPPEVDIKIEVEPVTLNYAPNSDGLGAVIARFGAGALGFSIGPKTMRNVSFEELSPVLRQAVAGLAWPVQQSQSPGDVD